MAIKMQIMFLWSSMKESIHQNDTHTHTQDGYSNSVRLHIKKIRANLCVCVCVCVLRTTHNDVDE